MLRIYELIIVIIKMNIFVHYLSFILFNITHFFSIFKLFKMLSAVLKMLFAVIKILHGVITGYVVGYIGAWSYLAMFWLVLEYLLQTVDPLRMC